MGRPRTSAAFMTVALLASPAGVSAAQPPETRVQYRSSDLTTDRGVRALYWRIVFAARLVCPPEDPRKLWQLVQSKECQRQAIARAVAKIGNPRLAALYAHAGH